MRKLYSCLTVLRVGVTKYLEFERITGIFVQMKLKITIQKNSEAAETIKDFTNQKNDFRDAVKSGRVDEYAEDNKAKISQPVRRHAEKWHLSI